MELEYIAKISYVTRPGVHDDIALDFVSHRNYDAHLVNTYLPDF